MIYKYCMKKLLFIAIVFILTICSCTKTNTSVILSSDSGCINRYVVPENFHTVSTTEKAIIDNLFQTNNLTVNHYRFLNYKMTLYKLFIPLM